MNLSLLVTFLALFFSYAAAAEPVTYDFGDQKFEGHWVKKSKNAPVVFIIHDWDGLTEYEVKRAEMLSKQGYSVFAIDLFGKGVRPTADGDRKALTGKLYKDRERMRGILNAALEAARSKGLKTQNAVVMGYCFGGAAALEWARSGADLKGFVSFHGGLETPEGQDYKSTRGKILVLHGSADASVTMEHFAKLTRELEEAKISHEMTSYSGAPHAFTVFGSERYREDADKKSWTRLLSFLKEATAR